MRITAIAAYTLLERVEGQLIHALSEHCLADIHPFIVGNHSQSLARTTIRARLPR